MAISASESDLGLAGLKTISLKTPCRRGQGAIIKRVVPSGTDELRNDVIAVGARIDFLQATTFDDAEHGGGPGAAVFRADKEPGFAPDGDGANGALGHVVFHREESVLEKDLEVLPAIADVCDGASHVGVGRV